MCDLGYNRQKGQWGGGGRRLEWQEQQVVCDLGYHRLKGQGVGGGREGWNGRYSSLCVM